METIKKEESFEVMRSCFEVYKEIKQTKGKCHQHVELAGVVPVKFSVLISCSSRVSWSKK